MPASFKGQLQEGTVYENVRCEHCGQTVTLKGPNHDGRVTCPCGQGYVQRIVDGVPYLSLEVSSVLEADTTREVITDEFMATEIDGGKYTRTISQGTRLRVLKVEDERVTFAVGGKHYWTVRWNLEKHSQHAEEAPSSAGSKSPLSAINRMLNR